MTLAHQNGGWCAKWLPDDEQRLVRMREVGIRYKIIAARLGRSEVACRVRWKRLRR